jgi:thioredoxin reductase (NADPH)
VPGEDLPHVNHYYTDAHPYYRQRVVVVGGKNSAAEACLELFRAGGYPTLVHRHAELGKHDQVLGAARHREPHQGRVREGALRVARGGDHADRRRHRRPGGREELPAEGVFLLTGYRPDTELMLRAGVVCDPETLAPQMNTETFETNVPNLFVAGGAMAGRHTGNIFIENGRSHGGKIVETLAQRLGD